MFDDLLEGAVEPSKTENTSSSSQSDYRKKFFKKKEEVAEEPYLPIAIFLDRDFPLEVKEKLYTLASKLIAKGYTIRINGDDKEYTEKFMKLSDTHVEVYIPWKGFNNIESKHYYSNLTAKEIARKFFPGWEKITDSVKSLLARNVRMLFGDKNNSISMCLITWSEKGESRVAELTKDTGKAYFIIKVAATYGFPVVNIGKSGVENVLEKVFGI